MTKLKLHTSNLTTTNIAKLAELFPNCVTEGKIDFDLLKQELSHAMVDGIQERYQLNWVGKKEALLTANAPIAKTLRPVRAESVNFDTTHNLYIEGDNLDALKLLQETYLNQIKMIYIDPPYNTGNDFIYADDFAEDTESYKLRSNQTDEDGNLLIANTESNGRFHSDWLSMMYARLRLARNLLRDDGVIFISIDDNEHANLKRLCDEVFGEQNFISQAGWQKVYSPKNQARHLSNDYEFVLIYCKQITNFSVGLLPRTEEMNKRYSNPDNDPRGNWKAGDLVAAGERKGGHYIVKNPFTGKEFDVPSGKHWAFSEDRMRELLLDNRITFGKNNDSFPSSKQFLSEVTQGRVPSSLLSYKDYGHTDEAKKDFIKLFGDEGRTIFETLKPVRLIKNLMLIGNTNKNDIILDFFSGSATTAHAVMQLNAEDGGNRKFILVQIPEPCDPKSEAYKAGYKTIADIGKERIRRAGQKIKTENGLTAIDLDIGFRVLKIDSSNMNEVYYRPNQTNQQDLLNLVDNIRADRSGEDLLFQVLLDWGIDLTLPLIEKTIDKKAVFYVADNEIVACFDRHGGITEDFIQQLAANKPKRVVFCDACFADDNVKINAEQIFKSLSPHTDIKTI